MSEIKKYTKKNGETAYKFRTLLGYDEVTGKQVKPLKSGFKTKKKLRLSNFNWSLTIVASLNIEI